MRKSGLQCGITLVIVDDWDLAVNYSLNPKQNICEFG